MSRASDRPSVALLTVEAGGALDLEHPPPFSSGVSTWLRKNAKFSMESGTQRLSLGYRNERTVLEASPSGTVLSAHRQINSALNLVDH